MHHLLFFWSGQNKDVHFKRSTRCFWLHTLKLAPVSKNLTERSHVLKRICSRALACCTRVLWVAWKGVRTKLSKANWESATRSSPFGFATATTLETLKEHVLHFDYLCGLDFSCGGGGSLERQVWFIPTSLAAPVSSVFRETVCLWSFDSMATTIRP